MVFFIQIERFKAIKVKYQDENGNEVFEQFDDNISELIQHEIDHLNGSLATDHLTDNKKIVMRKEWEEWCKT